MANYFTKAGACAFTLLALPALPVLAAPAWGAWSPYQHTLFISVDGMHASDLDKYVAMKPNSAFAGLLQTGIKYANAYTSGVSLSLAALQRFES